MFRTPRTTQASVHRTIQDSGDSIFDLAGLGLGLIGYMRTFVDLAQANKGTFMVAERASLEPGKDRQQ